MDWNALQDLFCSFSPLKIKFCGLGTTFDIFQNILFPYSLNTLYCLSWIQRIDIVSFVVSALELMLLKTSRIYSKGLLMLVKDLLLAILNGDSPIPIRVIDSVVQHVALTTAKQRLARKNKLKAQGTLLMALPDKYQLKFNIHKDAKTLMEKLISQLEILRESLSQEDIKLKFLRSLPTEWRTHTLIWRNKTDLEDQSLDDLFNSLKIYEAEVKSSSTTSTNESVSAVASAASTKVPVSDVPNVDTVRYT
nr:ribonuclease H-like domain-containing protein [Tanacetum cinerariifolium]